mmetsp:Transcript_10622/g.30241  ORF Transcript_10622/g.30241 Transcript_10622/m.30241 type:complete len:255 (+) Transcript_10622:263-1027(+)
MDAAGLDSEGKAYMDPSELWKLESGTSEKKEQWYTKAVTYWEQQPETYDGVLGGYGYVSSIDARDSSTFLKKVFAGPLNEKKAGTRKLTVVDCGAGVGRVSIELLLHHFDVVDLLEPVRKLLDTAESKISAGGKWPAEHKAGKYLCQGLQEFDPEPERYDVIWIQWAMLYLTDEDVVALFERCRKGLKPDGIIVVKENICTSGFVVDKQDSSLTRSDEYMLELFKKCGATVLYNVKQRNFPRELFDVRMYALKP